MKILYTTLIPKVCKRNELTTIQQHIKSFQTLGHQIELAVASVYNHKIKKTKPLIFKQHPAKDYLKYSKANPAYLRRFEIVPGRERLRQYAIKTDCDVIFYNDSDQLVDIDTLKQALEIFTECSCVRIAVPHRCVFTRSLQKSTNSDSFSCFLIHPIYAHCADFTEITHIEKASQGKHQIYAPDNTYYHAVKEAGATICDLTESTVTHYQDSETITLVKGKLMENGNLAKRRLLFWGVAPTLGLYESSSGFATTNRHILKAIYDTGDYELQVSGIGYTGDMYDVSKYPYHIFRAGKVHESWGVAATSMANHKFNIFFGYQDPWHASDLPKAFDDIKQKRQRTWKTVFWFPIDFGSMHDAYMPMVEYADIPVTQTQFGYDVVANHAPQLKDRLRVIGHGCDTDTYRPFTEEQKAASRHRWFDIYDDETFLICCVAWNSLRKNHVDLIKAFALLKQEVPNTKLYLHMSSELKDREGGTCTLRAICKDLGLSWSYIDLQQKYFTEPTPFINPQQADVIFPKDYQLSIGTPQDIMPQIYGASDVFALATVGEGWCLPMTEAFCMKLPVVVPNHTSLTELVGADQERGWLADVNPKKLWTQTDNVGLRPTPDIDDFVAKLLEVYQGKHVVARTDAAYQWALEHPWSDVCKQWTDLLAEL